ncbi:hypothetical protein EJ357_01355 [Streptomyces cyaneochromogenes]|uniref:Transposase n=1 Tax=Streptomyces cyaneochromogenes TaxID=2496836 RepID=A0A3S5HT73_9ACTN|nr:hypothetical protein EJ357_01355 [Streptomyces cyaneochromogenes]
MITRSARIPHTQSAAAYSAGVSMRSSRSRRTKSATSCSEAGAVGRPPSFDSEAHKQRNAVAQCINRLKRRRGIAIPYEKTATIYLAGLQIAGIFLRSRPMIQSKAPKPYTERHLDDAPAFVCAPSTCRW